MAVGVISAGRLRRRALYKWESNSMIKQNDEYIGGLGVEEARVREGKPTCSIVE
jgi:hypothetical protein